MPPPWIAAPAAAGLLAVAFVVNRRIWGFLPDDVPGKGRKAHRARTPLAGVVLLPVLVAVLAMAGSWWLGGAVLLAGGIGFLDDRCKERQREFDWRLKGIALLAASALAALAVTPAGAPGSQLLLAALLVFVLANATNFLDNTDGVACSLAAASLLLLGGGDGFTAIGFAALGFLPWNWPRPWLFLGDAGALALGIGVGAAAAARLPDAAAALLPVAVQLADFVQVVAARLWLGQAPWIGDRRHLPHIAQNLGLPRVLVAPLLVLLALLCGLRPAW